MALRAIERLKQAVSMSSSMRSVELPDGSSFEFWMTPLTIAERTRAQKQSKTDDATDFALQLLVSKAKDQDGRALFNVGEIAELRHELPASVVEALMLQLIGETTEEEEEVDYKSSKEDSVEGSSANGRTGRSRTVGQNA